MRSRRPQPGSPAATTTIDGRQLPPPPEKFGGRIEKTTEGSVPYWPARVVPPKGAPNILLVMTDDAGYGVPSTFGGVIPTPALDRIAASGLRYTNFNSTALCSPTCAALITGRNHHSVGEAIAYMNQVNTLTPDQPFFVYYVPGGTHAPHHPTPEWIKKISDMHLFDKGWNKLREQIFENQKKLGVIPKDAKLTPWPKDLLKDWDQCTPDEKKMFLRQVDVFAAYVAYTDHEIGRVIQAVEEMGKLDNTLIIYIEGDNGTSSEGTLNGTPNEVAMFNQADVPVADQLKYFYDAWGSDRTYNHIAVPWAWAFDTPFS